MCETTSLVYLGAVWFVVGGCVGWALGCWVAYRVARYVLRLESVEVRRD